MSIEEQIDEWVSQKIGEDFKFRQHQKEVIVRIIENVLNHKYHNYVVEAPTGSGKSLINIISAGVLADYYDITSYILVSDLFLWDQYEKFLKKHKNTGIASIKGQTGNYTCLLNGEDMKNADCKMAGLSWAAMFNKNIIEKYGYDCAYACNYVRARKKAVRAKVCIMTYQLFLFVMNNSQYNSKPDGSPMFAPHNVLFCDECHNIPEIVQLQYSPTISQDDFKKLEDLYNQTTEQQLNLFNDTDAQGDLYASFPSFSRVKEKLDDCWKTWTCSESRTDEDMNSSQEYLDMLEKFSPTVESVKMNIVDKKNRGDMLNKDDIAMFKKCSWFDSYMCHWHDYCTAIKEAGHQHILKDVNMYERDGQKRISVAFKCVKEDFITWYFFLQKAPYKVMTSATIGSSESYSERMGFHYEKKSKFDHKNSVADVPYMETIPSTFDFSESPVFFLNKFKMSFRERDISFSHLKNVIYSICSTKFAGQKGIIQTGSYEFMKRLYDEAPREIKKRMLIYNGSNEKVMMVKTHQRSADTILVGPSLNTGVDLPGDDCRFIIVLKVPYPSLADRLVNARNKLFPLWYNSHTSNEIIQGIGRGVRYNGDWCVTYILDACFQYLYYSTKQQYPKELQDRIKTIT